MLIKPTCRRFTRPTEVALKEISHSGYFSSTNPERLVLGSIYALIALGYTMVYGIMGLINFAHGEVVMFGAMVTISIIGMLTGMGLSLPGPVVVLLALMLAIPVCMLMGFAIERIAYRPLRNAPRLAPLITAIGLSIVLQNVAILIWGRNYIPFRRCCRTNRSMSGGQHH